MWNESISSTQAYIKQWFYDEQGANFIAARNNFEHVLISLWVTLKNFDEFLKIVSFPALPTKSWHVSWRCIAHDVLPYWDIIVQNLKKS